MSLSFYHASVSSYLQVLHATAEVLKKAEFCAAENGGDVEQFVNLKLRDDMLPFSFQVISLWHHSMGAIKGCQSGEFAPPPKMSDMNWSKVTGLVAEAIEFLESQSEDAIDALAGKPMLFKLGGREIPFTTDNFLMSFSLPNFYFHATTTYAILRKEGVPLGKMDFLGQLRIGH